VRDVDANANFLDLQAHTEAAIGSLIAHARTRDHGGIDKKDRRWLFAEMKIVCVDIDNLEDTTCVGNGTNEILIARENNNHFIPLRRAPARSSPLPFPWECVEGWVAEEARRRQAVSEAARKQAQRAARKQAQEDFADDEDFRPCQQATRRRISCAMSSASSEELPTSHLSSHIKRQAEVGGDELRRRRRERLLRIRRRLAAEEQAEAQQEAQYEATERKRCWRDVALRERGRKRKKAGTL
jgi:hypothetical protein